MTDMLQKALAEVEKLSAEEQDRVARWLLAELDDERRWEEAFAGSADQLADLAREAIDEHASGQTIPLDPEQL
jgi:hypothetical protein